MIDILEDGRLFFDKPCTHLFSSLSVMLNAGQLIHQLRLDLID